MGQVIAFAPRVQEPPAPSRTHGDDAHDAALWMGVAERWGWTAKEFRAPEHKHISGFIFLHDAVPDRVPLYTLVRHAGGWRLHSRSREMTEHETLQDALEAIFPTLPAIPERRSN